MLGVFAVSELLSTHITAPRIFWALLPVALGIGAACLIDLPKWWLGLGISGGAGIVKVIEALLVVLTDTTMIGIQRGSRPRR
jgi:hypothetical protein